MLLFLRAVSWGLIFQNYCWQLLLIIYMTERKPGGLIERWVMERKRQKGNDGRFHRNGMKRQRNMAHSEGTGKTFPLGVAV
jgi:hypothetical protein